MRRLAALAGIAREPGARSVSRDQAVTRPSLSAVPPEGPGEKEMLLLLSFNGIYTAGKPPAAQTIKPAHLIDPIHAPTRVLT